MILSRSRVDLFDVGLSIDRVLHRDACLRVVQTGYTRVDEQRYVPRLGRGTEAGRCRLSVLVRGHGTFHVRGPAGAGRSTPLRTGAAVLWPSLNDGYLALDPHATVLELDWTPTFLGPRPRAFDIGDIGLRGALEACVDDPFDRRRLVPAAWASDVVALLVAAGAPLERTPASALHDAGAAEYTPITDALDGVLSRLDMQPGTVDLEARLGLSPRQLARRIAKYHAYFGLEGHRGERGWRAYLQFYRLTVASLLLASDRVRVDAASRALGYGSPVALCHAFQSAGLPTPGALADLSDARLDSAIE